MARKGRKEPSNGRTGGNPCLKRKWISMFVIEGNPSLNGKQNVDRKNESIIKRKQNVDRFEYLNKTKTKSIRREEIYSDTEIQKRVQIQNMKRMCLETVRFRRRQTEYFFRPPGSIDFTRRIDQLGCILRKNHPRSKGICISNQCRSFCHY